MPRSLPSPCRCALLLATLLLAAASLRAQRIDYLWYFGNGAGIDFRSGSAVSVGGGGLNTSEGSAVATDPVTHNLVFYTDGVHVWDSTHQLVPTGSLLNGAPSSTQSALIVPAPGYDRRYYIFTSAEVEAGRNITVGVCYTILDFHQSNVVVALNVPLLAPAAEKLTAIGGCGEGTFWIIAHGIDTNAFYAYHLTDQGLDPFAVVSSVGPRIARNSSSAAGWLVASPTSDRLAMVTYENQSDLSIYPFDNVTGRIGSPTRLLHELSFYYGLCFSPDGSKIYTSSLGTGYRILQFDLSSNDSATMVGSRALLHTAVTFTGGAIAPGLDGKLYIVRYGAAALSVIDHPNLAWPACGYQYNIFPLTSGSSGWGLPNVIVSFGIPTSAVRKLNLGPDITVCPSQYVPLHASGADHYQWSPATGLSCSDCPNPIVSTDTTITYIVTGTADSGCGQLFIDTITVMVGGDLPTVARGTQVVCPGAEALLVAEVDPWAFIQWSSPTAPVPCDTCHLLRVHPTQTTTYYLDTWLQGGCRGKDSVTVVVDPNGLKVNTSDATSICAGGSAPVSVNAPGGSQVLWSPYETLDCDTCAATSAHPTRTTMYYVDVFDSTGCRGRDSVLVEVDTVGIPVDASGGTTICPGGVGELRISDFLQVFHIRWSPNVGLSCDTCTATEARPSTTTMYHVEVWDDRGCRGEDSVLVEIDTALQLNVAGTDAICAGGVAFLGVDAKPGARVRWSGGPVSCDTCAATEARPTSTTTYYVELEDASGCRGYDSVEVQVRPVESVGISAGGVICPGEIVALSVSVPSDARVRWIPALGLDCDTCRTTRARPAGTTTYRVTVESRNACYGADSVLVRIDSNGLPVSLEGPNSLCPGASATLAVETEAGAHIRWHGGPVSCDTCISNDVQPASRATYWVECWTDAGCRGSDTLVIDVSNNGLALDAGGDVDLCAGDTTLLTVSTPVPNTTVQWSPATGLDCDTCRLVHANPSVTTTYSVEVRNATGCTGRDSVVVRVSTPLPVVVSGGGTLCSAGRDSVTIHADVPPGAIVRWRPVTGLACDTCATTRARPTITTWYVAETTGGGACIRPDSVLVHVGPPVITQSQMGPEVVLRPGTPAELSLALVGMPGNTSVSDVEVEVEYDPGMLRLRLIEGRGALSGLTLLSEQNDWKGGSYRARFSVPSGAVVVGDGQALVIGFDSYYGGKEIGSTVRVPTLDLGGAGCVSVAPAEGRVRLDSLCWALMRGAELLPFGNDKLVGVSPDPAGEEVRVTVNVVEEKEIEVVAIDAAGLMHRLGGGHVVGGEHELVVTVGAIPSGWYRLIVRDSERPIGSQVLLVIH